MAIVLVILPKITSDCGFLTALERQKMEVLRQVEQNATLFLGKLDLLR